MSPATGGWRVPESKRELFKEPLGRPMSETDISKLNAHNTVTVGDVVSLTVRKGGIRPRLAVYDGFTERHAMTDFARFVETETKVVVNNPPGTITREMADAVRNAFERYPVTMKVVGEEDLALMPCILYAPDGTDIIYGWPGKGMMVITTDERIRKKTDELWKMMEEFE